MNNPIKLIQKERQRIAAEELMGKWVLLTKYISRIIYASRTISILTRIEVGGGREGVERTKGCC